MPAEKRFKDPWDRHPAQPDHLLLIVSIPVLFVFGMASLTWWAYLSRQAQAAPIGLPARTDVNLTTFFDGNPHARLYLGPDEHASVQIRLPTNATLHHASVSISTPASKALRLTNDSLPLPGTPLAKGDLDADGMPDLVTSATDPTGVHVLWGDSAPIDSWPNTTLPLLPGIPQNAGIGDFDNDGYDDLVLGYRTVQSGTGQAVILWGGARHSFGNESTTLRGDGPNTQFGASIAKGDLDGDGYDDLSIGAPQHPDGAWQGRVYTYWGGNRTSFSTSSNHSLTGSTRGDDFGWSVSTGDLNADGFDDLIVGAHSWPSSQYQGRAYIYWGNSGRSLYNTRNTILSGDGSGHDFGYSIATGDLDHDGHDDLIVGAPGIDHAYLYWGDSLTSFGLSNQTLHAEPDSGFGHSLAVPDLDGDGHADVVIGAPHYPNASSKGRLHVLWGGEREDINPGARSTFTGDRPGGLFSKSLLSIDLDQDLQDEILSSAPGTQTAPGFPSVRVLEAGTTQLSSVSLTLADSPAWTLSGLSSSDHTLDLYGPLSRALSDNCACTGCVNEAGMCTIAITLTSSSEGTLLVSDLDIRYTVD